MATAPNAPSPSASPAALACLFGEGHWVSTVWITEYGAMAHDARGNPLQIPQEPAVAAQTIDITTGPAISNLFSDKTAFVRVTGDAAFHGRVSEGELATATDARQALGFDRFFGVTPREIPTLRFSAIAAATGIVTPPVGAPGLTFGLPSNSQYIALMRNF